MGGLTTPEPTDLELLTAWAEGDAEAGSALVRRHFLRVYRFFRTKLEDQADELTQRTFAACLEARARFRGQSSFAAYLMGIARMQLLRYLQRELPRASVPLDPDRMTIRQALGFETPSRVAADREEQRVLLEALRRIPLDLQIAVELHYFEEMTTAEVAAALELPVGTIKSRLRRARELLRDAIDDVASGGAVRDSTVNNLEAWVHSLRNVLAPKN